MDYLGGLSAITSILKSRRRRQKARERCYYGRTVNIAGFGDEVRETQGKDCG